MNNLTDVIVPDSYETAYLLTQFIANGMDNPYKFQCPHKESRPLMQRIRVKLSRERKKRLRKQQEDPNVKMKHFRMLTEFESDAAHTGMDIVTVTLKQTIGDFIAEGIEDAIASNKGEAQ